MLRQYELVEKVMAYDPEADEDKLNRAYVFTMMAHGSQKRASGDPYYSHPIEVAGILTDLKLDDETIVTAILHDTIEDTVATHADIERLFGLDVARLVDGVTKLSKIEIQTESERAAENFRKFLLAMSDDIRVLLVKLADRLHNMRTLHFIPNAEKRQRIARETMDIYAPLAERIGMYEIKDELQAIAFRELLPEAHQTVMTELVKLRARTGEVIPRILEELQSALTAAGLSADVSGREKLAYSIWKKMQERHITFEQLSDVMAFRVTVDSIADCYKALGIIHTKYLVVPQRFKDYISTPKRNGYQSLHTTVIGKGSARIEIQIRTREMHRQAELGVAAHWSYKQQSGKSGQNPFPWLQNLIEILEHTNDPEEFLEHTKLEMYTDQVFCFTPKGTLIALPKGSTAIDFAYAVHTDVGNSCVGVKINGRPAPLRTLLRNGDHIEILRSKTQKPQVEWERFAITGKAKSAIRRHIKHQQDEEYRILGQKVLNGLVEKLGIDISASAIQSALERLNLPNKEVLLLALARHDISDADVMNAIVPGSAPTQKSRKKVATKGSASALTLKGLTPGVSIHLASCCQPILGDRIVAVRTAGHGFDVHAIDCQVLQELDTDDANWIDVAWLPADDVQTLFNASLQVVTLNQPGSLATVADIVARNEANIANMKLTHRDEHFHTFMFDLEVADLAHLTNIVAALRAAKAVSSVERLRA
jgi:GTP diphosphokinase / guanosine-3',5'-bis(diphosphate) 3'-diphosphatase